MDIKANKNTYFLLLFWAFVQIILNIFTFQAIFVRSLHVMFLIFFGGLYFKKLKFFTLPLTIFTFSYIFLNYNKIALRGGYLYKIDYIFAFFAIFLVLIVSFKINKTFTLLSLIFLSYLFWGRFISGPLAHNGFSLRRVLSHFVWGTEGIFGLGAGVSSSYIFLFMLFGSFLKFSGFIDFISDLSLCLVGKSYGSYAKVSVIASALMGMVNGSALANVATTGSLTIPLMKKQKYSSEYAAAVEAASSTGGQFAPPIMGAVAFVMAEFLNISYLRVVKAAVIPAFLYYLGIFTSVHYEAKKLNLKSSAFSYNFLDLLKERGHLLIPIFILIAGLFYFPLEFCVIISIFSLIGVCAFKKSTRMSFTNILDALVDGAVNSIAVGISCVLIGLIIGSVSLSGLGLNFGNMILNLNSHSLIFAWFLVAIMSLILGMGVPGVAAYVIVVSVAVPVLIKLGAQPIGAHLFCLIYACLSNITPPVAVSSYLASSIAESDMVKTSLIALKLAFSGFIFPFFFLINPKLIGLESPKFLEIIFLIVFSSIGVFAISLGLTGFFKKNLSKTKRFLFLVLGLLIMYPEKYTSIFSLIGLIFLLIGEMNFKVKNKFPIFFILMFFLTGCTSPKYRIDIPTASTTGALYPLGASLANVLNRDKDFRANIQASGGGIDNLNILYNRDANLSMAVNSIVSQSYEGKGIFKGRENKKLRIIASLYLNPNQILVRKDLKIKSLKDLKGSHFSVGNPGSTTELEAKAHFEALGMDINKDIFPERVSPSEAISLLKSKKISGVWIMAGAPSASVTEILLTANCEILNLDPDFIEKLNENNNGYENYTIKKSVYNNNKEINTSASPMVIFTSSDMSEECAYKITKAFWENLEELKTSNKVLKNVEIKNALRGIGKVPLHPGAKKYYLERGIK